MSAERLEQLRNKKRLKELRAKAAQATNLDTLKTDTQEFRFGPFSTGIDMSPEVTEYLAGLGRRITQLGTLGTYDDTYEPAERALDESGYATAGGITADVAGIPLGGALLKGASAAPVIGKAAQYVGQGLTKPESALQALTAAGTYGAATTKKRLEGGAGAAVGGGIGYGVPKVAGSVVKPQLQKGAQILRDKGINLTPGELLGGVMQRVEDGLTSVPLIGDLIKSAKGRSLTSWNKTLINDSLENVGAKLDDGLSPGRESIAAADDIISSKYDEILEGMDVRIDQPFAATMGKIDDMINSLPDADARYFRKYMETKIMPRFGGGLALGKTFKEIVSDLRVDSKRFMKALDPYKQDLGKALREVQIAITEMGKRQHPQGGAALTAADKAYAMMSRVRDASTSAGAREGVFTPAHLVAAVKKSATSKNQFARGRAYGQQGAEAAKSVLPPTVPDSGTPLRAIGGLGLMGGAQIISPPAAATMAGTAGLYTRPGQALAQTMIGARPPIAGTVRKGLDKTAPYSALLGAMLGVQGSQ